MIDIHGYRISFDHDSSMKPIIRFWHRVNRIFISQWMFPAKFIIAIIRKGHILYRPLSSQGIGMPEIKGPEINHFVSRCIYSMKGNSQKALQEDILSPQ